MHFSHPLLSLGISLFIQSASYGQAVTPSADTPETIPPVSTLAEDDGKLVEEKLTQQDIADRVGASGGRLKRIEKGDLKSGRNETNPVFILRYGTGYP